MKINIISTPNRRSLTCLAFIFFCNINGQPEFDYNLCNTDLEPHFTGQNPLDYDQEYNPHKDVLPDERPELRCEIENWETENYTDPLFKPRYLKQSKRVNQDLQEIFGFEKITFCSVEQSIKNAYILKGLIQINPNNKKIIICAGGFLPGNKEGLAVLRRHFPEDHDMLLFDFRHRGESGGKLMEPLFKIKKISGFISNTMSLANPINWCYRTGAIKDAQNIIDHIGNYGVEEYKDVLGAINYVNIFYPKKEIILFGLCSGAFHSVHALLHLSEKEMSNCNIKGAIFDSLWGNIEETGIHAAQAELLNKGFISTSLYYSLQFLNWSIVHEKLEKNKSTTSLFGKMQKLNNFPMLIMHCVEDTYTPIDQIKQLLSEIEDQSNITFWEITNSRHPYNQFKQKYEYVKHVRKFLKNI
ncbi:MAG: hypothetical protein UR26_C0006G0016 [candidate division TM6 bacterium GW2011_GWF2_32_72]|nr:MAG: hypothetical protein UR26_C0006G0016 [candidate division TM6 bacterium GW2011_GWF2_32_72]